MAADLWHPDARRAGAVFRPLVRQTVTHEGRSLIRDHRADVITVGRGHKTSTLSHFEPMFFHQSHDFLVVDVKALVMELRRHPAIAVQRELGTNLMHTFDKPGFINIHICGLVIIR